MAVRRYLVCAALALSVALGVIATPAMAARAHHSHSTGGGSLTANPSKVNETTKGSVSFALLGTGLVPDTKYKFDASTLSGDCKNNVNGKTVTADLKGRINFAASAGPNCVTGHFAVQLQERVSPFTVVTAKFTIAVP